MSALFIFKKIKKALVNIPMPLVCVIIITLLTTSCATAPTKQITSTDTTANSLATKEKSDNGTKEDNIDKIECRDVTVIGSALKRKVCEYKETWAAIDKENSKKAESAFRAITEPSGRVNEVPGPYNTVTSPMGGF